MASFLKSSPVIQASSSIAAVVAASITGTVVGQLSLAEGDESARYQKALSEMRKTRYDQLKKEWEYGVAPTIPTTSWPLSQPSEDEIPTLREALTQCNIRRAAIKQSRVNEEDSLSSSDSNACDTIQFDLAAALASLAWDEKALKEGATLFKGLAKRGNKDGMVGYANCLNNAMGVDEFDEVEAAHWWKQACGKAGDDDRHSQGCYELAVALYTGKGVEESEEAAAELFEDTVIMSCKDKQCHPAALYMLGDCLLEGIGTEKDRSFALELLLKSGVLGHRGARSRLLAVLESSSILDKSSSSKHGVSSNTSDGTQVAPHTSDSNQRKVDDLFTDSSRQSLKVNANKSQQKRENSDIRRSEESKLRREKTIASLRCS